MVNINEQYNQNQRYWFKKRRIGFGWRPATWEGWGITFFALFLILFISFSAEDTETFNEVLWQIFIPVGVVAITLVAICIGHGEPLNWRFWEKDK